MLLPAVLPEFDFVIRGVLSKTAMQKPSDAFRTHSRPFLAQRAAFSVNVEAKLRERSIAAAQPHRAGRAIVRTL